MVENALKLFNGRAVECVVAHVVARVLIVTQSPNRSFKTINC